MIKQLPGKYDATTVSVMFEFLHAAICDKEPQIENDVVINWDSLRRVSAEQGLLSWVWDGICMLPNERQPSRFERISWSLSAQEVCERYERQQNVLKDLIEICQTNNMRLMLLKGIGLSKLYPKPQSRPSGDIDIYLFDDFEKGNKMFKVVAETALHTAFDYKGVHIENHKTFIGIDDTTNKLVGPYLLNKTSQVVEAPEGYYTFASMDNLVYLIMHALKHVNFNINVSFLNIRNITDIAVLIKRYRSEWDPNVLLRIMKELHMDKSFELVLFFSEWLLKVDFSEYHSGSIKSKDVPIIKKIFMTNCLTIQNIEFHSIFHQFYYALSRYFYFHKIYKYMPHIKKSFFLSVMYQFIKQQRKMV